MLSTTGLLGFLYYQDVCVSVGVSHYSAHLPYRGVLLDWRDTFGNTFLLKYGGQKVESENSL